MIRHRTLCCLLVLMSSLALGESQLRFCLRTEPKTFNPLLVANDGEETIRYLTGGVLVRVNRQTQDLLP
jgi:peptide/nickel transport system substrate-binding protein